MPGPGGSSMPSSACGSRSRSSWRAVSSRSASSGCSLPLQLTLPPSETTTSTFALRSAPLRSTDEQVGRRRAAAGEQRPRSRATRAPRGLKRPPAARAPISRRKRGVDSTPSSRASTSARAAPVVSTAAAQAQMRQSGSSAAVSRSSASERANVARPASESAGVSSGRSARASSSRVEQRAERRERHEPARRLALGRGGHEQRERGVEPVEPAGGEDDGDHVVH